MATTIDNESSSGGAAAAAGARVFVRDPAYAWLPGTLTASLSRDAKTASVRITLPDDWEKYTHEPCHPSLEKGAGVEVDPSTGQECVVRNVKLSEYAGRELPLQNVDEAATTTTSEGGGETVVQQSSTKMLGKSDMADLIHLHEAAILYNLRNRHKNGVPYTRVGDIVVAMNPYQWVEGLYSEEKKRLYGERLVWNAQEDDMSNRQGIVEGYFERMTLDPHVYETSAHAYRGLAVDGRNQAVLVSGESGAGKTETVKIVMRHLATLEDTRSAGGGKDDSGSGSGDGTAAIHADVVKRIGESNPLFEAFGNAKTVRNDNSSRFGKFTKLHFDVEDVAAAAGRAGGAVVPKCTIAGSTFDSYLLEKARVVGHAPEERTFHLFYQLLAAPDDEKRGFWDGLADTSAASFRYVGTPAVDGIEGLSDGKAWEETRDALVDFGFGKEERLRTMMRAVCAVLQLGNVAFGPDPSNDEGSLVTAPNELEKLSGLLGVAGAVLTAALTTREVTTVGETITIPLLPSAARDGCDALAKEIYAQIFEELVEAINATMAPPPSASGKEERGWVSVLDMFGFEVFAVNRFEQLCINYANERIQHKYVTDTFLQLTEEYEEEGIDLYDFSKVDNTDIIQLIESPTGLIGVLNDECVRPKGSDESFVYKVKTIHRDSRRLVQDRLQRPHEFCISHFAGEVKYDARNFMTSNQDQLPKLLLDCASASTNALIGNRFKGMIAAMNKQQSNFRRKRAPATIATKFKGQLNMLMKDIKDARTRYIRCIKPNPVKLPLVMDHDMTMKQLASAGLVTAIMVSRETFPNNLRYGVIWDRFNCLLPANDSPSGRLSNEDKAKHLLNIMLKGKEKIVGGRVIGPFACGKTKVFFRSGSLEVLESNRSELYSSKAIRVQRWYRSMITERRRKAIARLAVFLQSHWRRKVVQTAYSSRRAAVCTIQRWMRCYLARHRIQQLRWDKAATTIQSNWKARGQAQQLRRMRRAADVIKRAIRNRKNKENFSAAMHAIVAEAQMDRKMQKLQRKLYDPSSHDKDALLKESSKMIEYLSKKLGEQRGKSSELIAENTKSKENDNNTAAYSGAVEAALEANKIENWKLKEQNKRLKSQVHECKQGTANLRVLLKKMQVAHDQSKKKHREEYSTLRMTNQSEVEGLKKRVRLTQKAHAAEVLKLRHEASLAKERHRAELAKMQEDNRKSEESHAEELSSLLDALGTAHEVDTRERTASGRSISRSTSGGVGKSELRKVIQIAATMSGELTEEVKRKLCDDCAVNTHMELTDLEDNMDELLKRV